jgi:hypothetical protein
MTSLARRDGWFGFATESADFTESHGETASDRLRTTVAKSIKTKDFVLLHRRSARHYWHHERLCKRRLSLVERFEVALEADQTGLFRVIPFIPRIPWQWREAVSVTDSAHGAHDPDSSRIATVCL